ncbi:MAG: hypothetical protein R3F56_16800 [Planctomycetota bacterium]
MTRTILLAFLTGSLIAQTPHLLLDVNGHMAGTSSMPRHMVPHNGATFFVATTAAGEELFVTDGTAAGTHLVRDIVPGPGSSSPQELTSAAGVMFFTADDGLSGRELWVTDGTSAGTFEIEVFPGASSSAPADLVEFGGLLYFSAESVTRGRELWRSDGTRAGTTLVADIRLIGSSAPAQLTVFGNHLAFTATDNSTGRELWITDGTASGTHLVTDLRPGAEDGTGLGFLVASNGLLLFSGNDGTTGWELFASDGTATGTRLVRDIEPGPADSRPDTFATLGNVVVFAATTAAQGQELWRSDGTTAGTFLLGDNNPGPNSFFPRLMVATSNLIFFVGRETLHGEDLWATDGTVAGTHFVAETSVGFHSPQGLTAFGNRILLQGNNGHGSEPWISDGTDAGTYEIADLSPGDSSPDQFAVDHTGTRALFSGRHPVFGNELWMTDGTAAGTTFVANVDGPESTASSRPNRLVTADRFSVFVADDGVHGFEPWITDATTAGTRLLADILPGSSGSMAVEQGTFVPARGGVFFLADDGVHGLEPWFSDGTTTGTVLVADIYPGPQTSAVAEMTAVGDRLFFTALSPSSGRELWSSDGTPGGTRIVFELGAGALSTAVFRLAAFGSRLVMVVDDVTHGAEPWITDGTAMGTMLLRDIAPGAATSEPLAFTAAGDKLFFTATTPAAGMELWATDGTSAGTNLVADIIPGPTPSLPDQLAATHGGIYFVAVHPTLQQQVWFSDGTAAGTMSVTSRPFGGTARPRNIVVLDGGVLFQWSTDLCRLDPTDPTGMTILTNGLPNITMTAVGSRYAWFGFDVGGRVQLWRSDGTGAGTLHFADIDPYGSSNPHSFCASIGRMLFVADHSDYGQEVWELETGALARFFGHGCSDRVLPPTFTATDPVLGRSMTLRGSSAVGSATVLVSLPSGGATSVGGCQIYLSPLALTTLFTIPVTSSWRIAVPLPGVAALSGVRLLSQVVFGPSTAPPGADLSNALELTLGF